MVTKIFGSLVVVGLLLACSDSNFAGSSGTAPRKETPVNKITPQSGDGLGGSQAGEETDNTKPLDIFNDLETPNDPQFDTDFDTDIVVPPVVVPPVTPVEIVDGQEVFTDCKSCFERAKQLAPQAGFTADMNKTYNLGFYKIEPSRNLCDIHFMADMSIRIDDHEGQDTVGNQQIIMYCPCNCAWASTTPPFGP